MAGSATSYKPPSTSMPFSDYPTEEKQLNWKPITIIVGAVVIAVILIVFSVLWIGTKREVKIQLEQVNSQKAAVEQTCETATDKSACVEQQMQKLASQTGNVLFCDGLSGDVYDACVWDLANDQKDPQLCSSMQNSDWKLRCEDGNYYAIAVDAGDVKLCDKIQNENKRSGCHRGLEPITAENCSSVGGKPEKCQFLNVVKLANQKQDAGLCDQLADEEQAELCKEEYVLIDDPDFDGLETDDELNYKTDPYKADTDGDGYNDLQEISAGYNPLGPGKL